MKSRRSLRGGIGHPPLERRVKERRRLAANRPQEEGGEAQNSASLRQPRQSGKRRKRAKDGAVRKTWGGIQRVRALPFRKRNKISSQV